jgi:predicted CDP-diglyceride synthetase/phosphatidate cytidylyltransferase
MPPIVLALALALLLAAPFAFLAGTRGGRFRAMPGWLGFWVFFGALLVCLSRAPLAVSLPFLGAMMFAGLKQYLFLAPVRPHDRWAIAVAYLFIPGALIPAYLDSLLLFESVVSVGLLFLVPVLLSLGAKQAGLFDSMGRLYLGVLLFIFGGGHLGFLAHEPRGTLELFAILVLVAELPQRLVGRPRPGQILRATSGVLAAFGLDAAIGVWLGPLAGLGRERGLGAGLLVAAVVTLGAVLADAAAEDLSLDAAATRLGRGAFLDRALPALYAAPAYYLYLIHTV